MKEMKSMTRDKNKNEVVIAIHMLICDHAPMIDNVAMMLLSIFVVIVEMSKIIAERMAMLTMMTVVLIVDMTVAVVAEWMVLLAPLPILKSTITCDSMSIDREMDS